jgi:hypothetical protein
VGSVGVLIASAIESESYWNAMAYIASQVPRLSDAGISGYMYLGRNVNDTYSGSQAIFFAFNKTSDYILGQLAPIEEWMNQTWPNQFQIQAQASPDSATFYGWWAPFASVTGKGVNTLLASRLFDTKALGQPLSKIEQMLRSTVPTNGVSIIHLVAGKGVQNAKPSGGSDAVNPAWRKAYFHYVSAEQWSPLNNTAKNEVIERITKQYIPAMTDLAPNSGAYINEAYPDEENYQKVFWGSHYPRLLAIKRRTDPRNVFWCHPCVGDEDWEVVNDRLCEKSGS